jgi:DNA-binding NarL/FixJ family response regulator
MPRHSGRTTAQEPVAVVVITDDKRRFAQIRTLTTGSHVAAVGWLPPTDDSLAAIAKQKPRALIIDGYLPELNYLRFSKLASSSLPHMPCIVVGPSRDVTVFARAAIHCVREYLPASVSYAEFVAAVSAVVGGTPTPTQTAFARVAGELAIPEQGIEGSGSNDQVAEPVRHLMSKCLQMGLSVEETADYLTLPHELVKDCGSLPTQRDRRASQLTATHAAYAMALGGLALSVYLISRQSGTHVPRTEPVQGQIVYEDGSMVPGGVYEVTLFPESHESASSSRIGRAVLDPNSGRVRNVVYAAKHPGLPRGVYKVTIRAPGQISLPAAIASTEYGDPARTPLSVDVRPGANTFTLKLKKPAELMKTFDVNADGVLDTTELSSLKNTVAQQADFELNDDDLERVSGLTPATP